MGKPRKLTESQVLELRAWHASPRSVPEMAAHLGVSEATVVRAIHGRTYKAVGRPAPQGGPQLGAGISRG